MKFIFIKQRNYNECKLSTDSIYSPRSDIPREILKTKQIEQIEKQIKKQNKKNKLKNKLKNKY